MYLMCNIYKNLQKYSCLRVYQCNSELVQLVECADRRPGQDFVIADEWTSFVLYNIYQCNL